MVLKRLFIIEPGEDSTVHLCCSGVPLGIAFEQIVLLGSRSWKGHLLVTLWKTTKSLFRSPGRQCSSDSYNSFTLKMVLKRLFVSDTWRNLCMFIHVSWETKFVKLIWQWKMVLKRMFAGEKWETSACSLSGLQGDRAHQVDMIGLLRRMSFKGIYH